MKVKINNLLFYNLYKYIINNILLYDIINMFIFYYKLI